MVSVRTSEETSVPANFLVLGMSRPASIWPGLSLEPVSTTRNSNLRLSLRSTQVPYDASAPAIPIPPTRLTGYYVLFALTERGEGLLRDGSMDVGVAMPAAETVANPRDARAFYIGMIQGLTTAGKREIHTALAAHVLQLCEENGGELNLYARGASVSSRRYVDLLGFFPAGHPPIECRGDYTRLCSPALNTRKIRAAGRLVRHFAPGWDGRSCAHGRFVASCPAERIVPRRVVGRISLV